MAGYEQPDNAGALFKNKRKQPGGSQPDYTGPCKVNGVELDVSVWIKKSQSGMTYMSLSFKPKWVPQQNDEAKSPGPERQPESDLDDPLDF